MCSGNSKLSIASLLDIFQDIATLHADYFDIGPAGMNRRNYFWVITRTRVHINRLPGMMEDIKAGTWIMAPERASCERDFSIEDGDETLAYGRSIWAVMSRERGKLVHINELYPRLDFNIPPADDRPFTRMSKDFSEAEIAGEYTVKSIDIDIGGHMNNVNYVRALAGCYPSKTIFGADISEIEMNYVSQTYEGETLTFKSRNTDKGFEAGAVNEKGRTVFIMSVS